MSPPRFDPIAEARRQWEASFPGAPFAAMTAVTSVMRAQQILLGRLNEALAPYDLTFARYEALMVLHFSRRGEIPLGKLSDRLQVHRASVTNVVDKLAESGYAERVSHTSDRRAILARITPAGRATAAGATAALHEIRFGTEPLTDAAAETVSEVLLPLRRGADAFPADAPTPVSAESA